MLSYSQIASVFRFSPFPSLVLRLDPHFTIAGVNQAYLNATGAIEGEIVGKGLFGAFPESGSAEGDTELKCSLEQVLITKAPAQMTTQRYRLPYSKSIAVEPGYRMPVNTPVLNEDGEITFILFTAVDITDNKAESVKEEKMKRPQKTCATMRITGQKLVEEQKNEALHKLQERIKEQSCLYRISSLNEQNLSIGELLDEAAAILPGGWQYQNVTAAAIEYDGKTYMTPNYSETPWMMSAEIGIRKESSLTVKVVYLEERPLHDEGPFLKEERKLIDSIINHLALKIDRILSQQELEEKQLLLDKAYQLARIGTWEFDMLTHELKWSPVTKEVHGFGPDYQPDVESTIDLFKEGINRNVFAQAVKNAIEKEQPFDVELKIISGQGDERWIRATGEPEYKDRICTRFYGISQNVSGRRQAEEDLQLSEQRFKSLVQDGSDLIAILDERANFTYVSPTSETVLGKPADDFIGTNALDYIHEDDKDSVAQSLFSLPSAKRMHLPPYRFIDGKGNWRWIETILTNMTEDPAVGGLVANSRDITQQKVQQQQNLESLKEKETLLAEIHHRVKNNLAVVSGMMQLQASEEENKEIINKLFDGIIRIKTMANIHEQLYQSNSFSKLEFAANIRALVLNIQKTFQSSETPVHIDFHCEPVQLNINQAIPCSLIVNEVVTNIFKHAFPERKEGEVIIRLSEYKKTNQLHLSIRDNGVGFPENFDAGESSSLGLNLIDVLSQQLSAEYVYEPHDEGTTFTIRFEKDELKGIGNSFLI